MDNSGVISGSERDSLYLWQDSNGDGNFDGGETSTLVANNIDSISLNTAYLYELPESINSSIELGGFSGITVGGDVFLGPASTTTEIPLTRSDEASQNWTLN